MDKRRDVKPCLSSGAVAPKSFSSNSRIQETSFMSRNFNYAPILTDEITLEGLDGITLQALWIRLEHRRGFNLSVNETSKPMFWESLRRNRYLEFYELPVNRPDLIHYDRNDYVDERGNNFEPLSAPEDIYLYAPVDDGPNNIRGSCHFYKERRDVGAFVRKLKLDDVVRTYGNKLVVVAHQDLRDKILFHNACMEPKELSIVQYCILERVARARYHGESTRGKVSLAVLKIDAKTLFYHRKFLIAKQLVTKQAFSMKFGPNRLSSLITIFHLPRFYMLYKSNQARNVERLFNELQRSPNYRRDLVFLKHQYGKSFIETICREYLDAFELQDESMSVLHPERVLELKNKSKAGSFGQRQLKVLQLRNPDMNFTTYLSQKAAAKEDEEDTESTEKDIFVVDEIRCQTSVLVNSWKYFIQKFVEGCTLAELIEKCNMFLLDARAAARYAAKLNLVVSIVEDAKKTKFQRFVYFKCSEANETIRHLTTSLPTDKVVGVGSAKFYRALDRIRFDATNLQGSLIPIVEMTEQALPLPSTSATISRVENEPIEILSLEDNITNRNQFTLPSVTEDGENLSLIQETGNKTKAQSTCAENLVFIPVQFVDTFDEEGMLLSRYITTPLTYTGLFGWQISIELAEVNSQVIKDTSFLVNSVKTVRRVKFILDLISTSKFIGGSTQILQTIRVHETQQAQLEGNDDVKMDRISLFRILKELHKEKQIHIWKITLSFDKVEKTIIGFTSSDTLIDSPHLQEGINSLIRWLHSKFIGPRKRKVKNLALKKIGVRHRKPKVKSNKGETSGTIPVGDAMRISKRGTTKLRRFGGPVRMSRTIYDKEDLAAKQRMKRQRSYWTPIEDSALMYVFIASVLFFPRYRLGKLIMYNSAQLRDVLHRKLKEARSKTAVAIRRRFHFLMRRLEMHARLRQNLALAVHDRDLKIYIKDKYEPAAMSIVNQSYAQISVEGVSEVYDYLQEKFETGSVRRPNKILSYTDTIPESKKRKLVIGQVEHSKRPRREGIEPDPLDFSDFEITDDDTDYIPLEFANTLVSKPHGIIQSVEDAEEDTDINLITAKATLFSLLFSGHPSEVVIGVVDRLDEAALSEALNYLREQTIITVSKSLRFTLALPMKRRLQSFLTPLMYNYADRVFQSLQKSRTFNATKVGTISSLHTLAEICAHASSTGNLIDIQMNMPLNVVDFNTEWKSLLKTPGSSSAEPGPSSRLTASSVVDDADACDEDSLYELNLRDFKSRFIKTLGLPTDHVAAPNIFNLILPHIQVNFKNLEQTLDPELPAGIDLVAEVRNYLLDEVPNLGEVDYVTIPSEFLTIARAIYCSREKGVMILTLKEMFNQTSVKQAVDYLLSLKLVFLVGNEFCRLVGLPFIKLWSCKPISSVGFSINPRRIIVRPWITSVGEINWQLTDQLLSSLIGYIELHPGCSVRKVANSVAPVISEVDGVILLKVLHRLKLISVFGISTGGFSSSICQNHGEYSIVAPDEEMLTLQFETLFVELTDFYTLKYSALQHRLAEVLGKDAFTIKSSTSYTAIDPAKRRVVTPKKEK